MIHTDAGYYTPVTSPGGAGVPSYMHVWYLKDHLGNNRVLADGSGKEWSVPTSTYDFGARHYTPSLPRWLTMDPLAEKYYSISPYTYCADDPVNFVDNTGQFPTAFVPIPIPVIEKIIELTVVSIGVSFLLQYIIYRVGIDRANSEYSDGWKHQNDEDRKAKRDFDTRQLRMQNSIDDQFPGQNDPNRSPKWNGRRKWLAVSLFLLDLLGECDSELVSSLLNPSEEELNQTQNESKDYYFVPASSENETEDKNQAEMNTDWRQSLINHMNTGIQ